MCCILRTFHDEALILLVRTNFRRKSLRINLLPILPLNLFDYELKLKILLLHKALIEGPAVLAERVKHECVVLIVLQLTLTAAT
jgi:hypothetical protein